ncbi:MAG: hypothetical protein HYV97_02040 [Bdellovibrio sp.]|nr:hypothetical protein [Bdellovibrio sp.]
MFNCHRVAPLIKVSFFWGLFIPFLAIAQHSDQCVAFRDMGKFCFPHEGPSSRPLLVFIRGLYQGSGRIESTTTRMTAASSALRDYHLDSFDRPVLVMGSSHLGLDSGSIEEIEMLYRKFNLGEFNHYDLASHSGGYAGLFETLREALATHIRMPKTILMLDNFYSVQAVNIETYQKVLAQEVACGGFLTTHNHDRYQRLYKNAKCTVTGPEGQNHNLSVIPTLKKFLE